MSLLRKPALGRTNGCCSVNDPISSNRNTRIWDSGPPGDRRRQGYFDLLQTSSYTNEIFTFVGADDTTFDTFMKDMTSDTEETKA